MKNIFNLKSLAFGVLSLLTGSIISCNSDTEYIYTLPSSATVTSFSLAAKASVLPNLDSVFFSIDLYSGEIFNADSLPFGTDITSLTPVIVTESSSSVEITGKTSTGEEKTYDYSENTTDTLDFTQPVTIKVVSYDGAFTKNYNVKVNVHQVRTDTLVWSKIEGGTLPTKLNVVEEQHTSMSPGGNFYCLTGGAGKYCIATAEDPGSQWQVADVQFEFVPKVESFTATNDALYILSATDELYVSEDNGISWSSTGKNATSIIGAYGNSLLSSVLESGNWYLCDYPADTRQIAPTDFPVSGTSNATTISFEMSISKQMLVTGGRKSSGDLSGATWGYDGTSWMKISRYDMPVKAENMALVPYFEIKQDSVSWKVAQAKTVLLAMCGKLEDGTLNDTIYMTTNFGMTWSKAPDSMQIPHEYVKPRTQAQAYPYSLKVSESSSAKALKSPAFRSHTVEWQLILNEVPENVKAAFGSRATSPITEWEVPYIYLFGGKNSDGITFNEVYRGAITLLTFKPLQ